MVKDYKLLKTDYIELNAYRLNVKWVDENDKIIKPSKKK